MSFSVKIIGSRLKKLSSVIFFCVALSPQTSGQNDTDHITRQQRVLFVNNVAQQIVWGDIADKKSFVIGVLRTDPSLADFRRMSRNGRKILGKPTKIVIVDPNVLDLSDVDILYANKNIYRNSTRLLNSAIANKTLLITEDFLENRTMINITRDNEKAAYVYQINELNISSAGLSVSSILKQGAVQDNDKWLKLYQQTEKELTKVEEQNENQKEIIEHQLEVIDSKEEVITNKEKSIKTLINRSNSVSRKLSEQMELEKELEERIDSQTLYLEQQQARYDSIRNQVSLQQDILDERTSEITVKEEILREQIQVIQNQRTRNLLLLGLLLISTILLGVIFYSLLKNKRLNTILQKQKNAIVKQSDLLEAKNRELEQFAYITSHDLQEPLNSVSSFIGMLQEDYEDKFDEDGKAILGFIKEGSSRMGKLINALLQYSRLGRNRDFAPVDTNKLLDNVRLDISYMIKESNAELIVHNLPTAYANEMELGLLFQNLISNAIKFRNSDAHPIVIITGKEIKKGGKAYHQFSIRDNGIGIKEEHIERIFGIFQRLHSREDYRGSGIGLAHCEKIIKSHDGDIWVESELGKGSTFHFTIPMEIKGLNKKAA